MVREPLTPWIPLLPLAGRMEGHVVQLARVLSAVQGAVRLLVCRLQIMAGGQSAPAGVPGRNTPWDLAEQQRGIPRRALQLLQAALREATLTDDAQAAAAAMPAAAAANGGPASRPFAVKGTLDARPWTRLPYPLASGQAFSEVEVLPGMAGKPVFKAVQAATSGPVLIKFTPRTYPEQVGLICCIAPSCMVQIN